MAFRTLVVTLLIVVFAIGSYSQTPDLPISTEPAAIDQDQSRGDPASSAQQTLPAAPQAQKGTIFGTVTDIRNDIVAGATVLLAGPGPTDRRTVETNDRGLFEFTVLGPGNYHVVAGAKGFANWTSPLLILHPGQALIVTGCTLKIAVERTTVDVGYSSEQIATAQVKVEEQQRVLGFLPNFYVSYDPNAEPLTTKLKFRLAYKTSFDAVTFLGIAVLSSVEQAADYPDYVEGMKGYGQRFGAVAADSTIDIMFGGAILPSLLHQDPRYFYQGTGTTKSRIRHAMSSPFICKGDNGRLQPNYSTVGGDLVSSAIANAYYPASDRGAGLVFRSFFIDTAARVAADLAQEFLFRRLTPKARKQK